MNITCIICSDVILPHSEVHTTQCGHLFHYACLIQWIERSKTCPQCRNKTTEKTIYRVFFNLANTDHIADDVVTLQNKLDNLQFQMTLKEKDVNILKEKYNKTKNQNLALRGEISELENKIRVHDSVVHALKDQISFFKTKSKERDRLVEELSQMKSKLKDLELVQLAISGTREEVNSMLRNECNVESLVILSATLKKALLDTEKKKLNAEYKVKQLQTDVNKFRKDIISLESSNDELRKELEYYKINWEQEKEHLTKVVKNLNKKGSDGNTPVIKRLLSESPVPLRLKCPVDNSKEIINLDDTHSPSVEEKVIEILDSDSPYLPVKTSGISSNSGILQHRSYSQNPSSSKKLTIFKGSAKKFEDLKPHENDEIVYNGLGGQAKKDVFPTPKTPVLGIKRYKTNSSFNVSSAKLRKLNPASSLKK